MTKTLDQYYKERAATPGKKRNSRAHLLKEPLMGWYINKTGNRLPHGDNRKCSVGAEHDMVERRYSYHQIDGQTVVKIEKAKPDVCARGLHASPTLVEAEAYKGLPRSGTFARKEKATIWLVELSGYISMDARGARKVAASNRKYIKGWRVTNADAGTLMDRINKLRLPTFRTRSNVMSGKLDRKETFASLRDLKYYVANPAPGATPEQHAKDIKKVERVIGKWLETLPVVRRRARRGTDSKAVA